MSAGYRHTCGVRSTGAMYCWGDDSIGQLGDGSAGSRVGVPQLVAGSVTDWRSVSAGEAFSCAVRSVGRLYCWGGGDINGELGNGSAHRDRAAPGQVSGKRTDWKQVSAGQNHACGLRTTGRAGLLGLQQRAARQRRGGPHRCPGAVAAGRTDWASVDTGSGHTYALRTSRWLFCWGSDTFGQLGGGASGAPRLTPGQVIGGARDWSRLTVGGVHSCAVKTTGRAYCWGSDTLGELGDGDPLVDSAQPRQLVGGSHGPADRRLLGPLATHLCHDERPSAVLLGVQRPRPAGQRHPHPVRRAGRGPVLSPRADDLGPPYLKASANNVTLA